MTEKNWLQNLTKSDTDKWIGGVCGGLGESSPIPSWVWRVLFVLFFFGPGFFIYILLWIFVPSKAKA
ncbi:MAG: PspC domain-containing protein [Smithella sp.]|nr:PspC domain-containing protein [Smithella sp.]